MARYTGPRFRQARREGEDLLFNDPRRSMDSKCRHEKKPGMHGDSGRRGTDYERQLREKQKVKRMYGLLEKQFRLYYKRASSKKGATGENLLQLLESRLDNLVYRIGFALTRREARQLVSHKAMMVNGEMVNIPSYQVCPGDIISVREKAKNQTRITTALDALSVKLPCEWVKTTAGELTGEYLRMPSIEELPPTLDMSKIVELYSK